MSKQFLSRGCPACGASAALAVKDVASEPTAEATAYSELIPVWNGFFKDKVFFSYQRCGQCGLLYAPLFFTPEQLEELYAQMPPNMDLVPIEALRKTQRGYFQSLKELSSLQGDYIEIGPDIGLFTENCVREGQFGKYWLFEPNRDIIPALTETMQGKQHEIIHDMFGFSQVPDKAAGAAVMVHVLDHLLDPVATLRELREKLMPGARLAIVTHDESSLLRRVFGKRWPAFCLQHPEIYNPRSMKRLLDTAGYDVVQLRKTVNHFPVQFLLRHLLWALGLKIKSVPSFGGITVGLKLGNMITIATPKAN
ncbi:methyltransferase type 12 [Rhizobium sp. AC27/96]|nr:methyltransferase type 12 [Rhizobium sp. AC27/96]